MKKFQIYKDGEGTEYIYEAETEKEAYGKYVDDYIEGYRTTFHCYPNGPIYLGDIRAIEINK